MKNLIRFLTIIFLAIASIHCGMEGQDDNQNSKKDNTYRIAPNTNGNPGQSLDNETGDDYEWGKFVTGSYETREVQALPTPVYLAYFNENEKSQITEGIEIANQALGFDVFEVVDEWSDDCRIIYKVNTVEFDDEHDIPQGPGQETVGYTYVRNLHLHGHQYNDVIVTDWAMELKANRFNKWIVAHELGHAAGIIEHGYFDENDALIPLPLTDLMAAKVLANPTMEEYNIMMSWQGDLLLEYLERVNAN